jgi:hypothetical protein
MHNAHYDDLWFAQQYMRGLKDETRGPVESQMPTTVQRASILAKIQQKGLKLSTQEHHIIRGLTSRTNLIQNLNTKHLTSGVTDS